MKMKLPTAGKSNKPSAPASKNSSPVSRSAFKKGGAVKAKGKGATVNIIVAGQNPTAPSPMMAGAPGGAPPRIPMPAPGPAMAPPAGGLAGPPGLPPGVKPPMKRGGHVMAGAGTGLGRLQKAARAK